MRVQNSWMILKDFNAVSSLDLHILRSALLLRDWSQTYIGNPDVNNLLSLSFCFLCIKWKR